MTEAAGVAGGNDPLSIVADALWFDYDNDGWRDLLVARFGTPILYHNEGNGKFKDVSAGVRARRSSRNTIAAIAFDYDNDGRLDLLFGNYFQPVNLLELPDAARAAERPRQRDQRRRRHALAQRDRAGDGCASSRRDREGRASPTHTGWTLDLGHGDFNNDGCQDVYLACDYGTDRLFYSNNGDGTLHAT